MAGFVLVIPEQMMCLRPYGRPLGLLCAVTDVAHVNFKGFLLHFKNPPAPSPSAAAADLQDEWGVSSMLIWQSVPFVLYTASSPLLLLLLTPAALQPAHSQLQTLFFWVKGTVSNVPCSQQQLLLDLAILQHKGGERAGVSVHLCAEPLLSFSALCAH